MMEAPAIRGLNFSEKQLDGARLMAVIGNIDTESYSRFDDHIMKLVDDGVTDLILDLERALLINSMGVGVIVRTVRVLKEKGGGLVLLNPSPGIRQVLNTLRLEKKIPITATIEDALQILSQKG